MSLGLWLRKAGNESQLEGRSSGFGKANGTGNRQGATGSNASVVSAAFDGFFCGLVGVVVEAFFQAGLVTWRAAISAQEDSNAFHGLLASCKLVRALGLEALHSNCQDGEVVDASRE